MKKLLRMFWMMVLAMMMVLGSVEHMPQTRRRRAEQEQLPVSVVVL